MCNKIKWTIRVIVVCNEVNFEFSRIAKYWKATYCQKSKTLFVKYVSCLLMILNTGWSTMSVYWQWKILVFFLSRNWHWPDVLTWHNIKKIRLISIMFMLLQKWTFDGKFQICLSKQTTGNAFRLQWYQNHSNFHCYQHIQSLIITRYFNWDFRWQNSN
jgi:hypothetical protein